MVALAVESCGSSEQANEGLLLRGFNWNGIQLNLKDWSLLPHSLILGI